MFGGRLGIPELLVLMVFLWGPLMIVVIPAWWRIFTKAGYPGPLSLAMIVPIVGLVLLLWFASSTWPIEVQGQKVFPTPPPPK